MTVDSSKTTSAQYIQEAEEAFERAKGLLEVAASHNFSSARLTVQACSLAARDELALASVALQIAGAKMRKAGVG